MAKDGGRSSPSHPARARAGDVAGEFAAVIHVGESPGGRPAAPVPSLRKQHGYLQTQGDLTTPGAITAGCWLGHRFHVAMPASEGTSARRRPRKTPKTIVETADGLRVTNMCDSTLRDVRWFRDMPPGAVACTICASRSGLAAQERQCAAVVVDA